MLERKPSHCAFAYILRALGSKNYDIPFQVSALREARLQRQASRGGGLRFAAIRYTRERITVVDRPQLERLSCECYSVVKKEEDRLLAHVWPRIDRATI